MTVGIELIDCPSDTFWYQLGLFYNIDGKITHKDKSTRQYYMERTTSQFKSEWGHRLGGKTDRARRMENRPCSRQDGALSRHAV